MNFDKCGVTDSFRLIVLMILYCLLPSPSPDIIPSHSCEISNLLSPHHKGQRPDTQARANLRYSFATPRKTQKSCDKNCVSS